MAGKPGMKGGGGKREGAGRKKNEPVMLNLPMSIADCMMQKDPLAFLIAVMNDAGSDGKLRIDAAKAALPFVHTKPGEASGKKGERMEAAKKAGGGKFAPAAPPKLVAAGGKKV